MTRESDERRKMERKRRRREVFGLEEGMSLLRSTGVFVAVAELAVVCEH